MKTRTILRLIALGLALILSMTLMFGCNNPGGDGNGNNSSNSGEDDSNASNGGNTSTPTVETYTVKFIDFDGTVLHTVDGIKSGDAATAPQDPAHPGYKFIGWDKSFDNVTSDLTVKALYEFDLSAYTTPIFAIENVYASASDTVTVNVHVKNNPGILGMLLNVNVDDSIMTLVGAEKGNVIPSLTLTPPGGLAKVSPYTLVFDGIDITDEDKADGVMLTLTFKVSDNAAAGVYNITLSYVEGDIFDANINILNFDIINGVMVVE